MTGCDLYFLDEDEDDLDISAEDDDLDEFEIFGLTCRRCGVKVFHPYPMAAGMAEAFYDLMETGLCPDFLDPD